MSTGRREIQIQIQKQKKEIKMNTQTQSPKKTDEKHVKLARMQREADFDSFNCIDLDIEKILSEAYIEAGMTIDSMMDFIRSNYPTYNQNDHTQELWNSVCLHATNEIMPKVYEKMFCEYGSEHHIHFYPRYPSWGFLIPPTEIVKQLDFYDLVKNNENPHVVMFDFVMENIESFIDLSEAELQMEMLNLDATWEIMCQKYIDKQNKSK